MSTRQIFHLSMVVSRPASAVSATEIASRLAGSVVLAFSVWRILRGGSWGDFPNNLRSATRNKFSTFMRNYALGFRVARTLTLKLYLDPAGG
jgi:formylglycine-generating enzyme required for sulfatase activity